MAENKKSFVLYADLIKSIDHLTYEEKGILFTHLLDYVNDKNPILTDRLILTAWKPIEQQLKRDLREWELKKIDKSMNGKIGNLKRWHIDLYNKVVINELTINEALIIASSLSDNSNRTQSQQVAKVAVNVNDNVNANVTLLSSGDDAIDRSKTIFDEFDIKDLAKKLFSSSELGQQREGIMMKHKINNTDLLKFMLVKFNEHKRSLNELKSTSSEYGRHFNNWLNKTDLEAYKIEFQKLTIKNNKPSINETYGNYTIASRFRG